MEAPLIVLNPMPAQKRRELDEAPVEGIRKNSRGGTRQKHVPTGKKEQTSPLKLWEETVSAINTLPKRGTNEEEKSLREKPPSPNTSKTL